VPRHAKPARLWLQPAAADRQAVWVILEVAARIDRLLDWWGKKKLAEVTPVTCRAYLAAGKRGGVRRNLEDLRAAINHHAARGLHTQAGSVMIELPQKGAPRTRWLTRSEVARLLWVCWRYREKQTIHRGRNKGQKMRTDKRPLRHLARFILTAIYTGSRSGAIFTASIHLGANRSFVDLDRGRFYRLAEGKHETNKRQPTAPLPNRLLTHLRRWRDKGIIASHLVEWQGLPVQSVKVAWKRAIELAGLPPGVTPHTLRHTAATWLMQNGTSTWEAAGYLGMSEQMVRDVYGHHHPDYMGSAAANISKKGRAMRVQGL
jgi:integrase